MSSLHKFMQHPRPELELTTGIEPVTSSLPRKYSTTEPRERYRSNKFGAGEEARTLDPQLGRLVLYQLSYTRSLECKKSTCYSDRSQAIITYTHNNTFFNL